MALPLEPPTCDYCGTYISSRKDKYCEACLSEGAPFEVVIFDHAAQDWRVNEIGVGLLPPSFNSKGAASAYISCGSAAKDSARRASP